MNPPIKHHFNPAFSLRPWAVNGGELCEMRRINGNISPRRVHPNGTGFQKNLYRTDGVPQKDEQHLETNFMYPLDTAADLALRKIMEDSPSSLNTSERSAWVRYIISLVYRNPETVESIKNHIVEMWDAGIKEFEENYASRRLPTDPPTFAEYFALTHPATPQIGATNFLVEIIDNYRVGPTIFDMHWSRIDIRSSNVSLLNSDRPIDRPLGLDNRRAYIAFPIGPYSIFLAAHGPTLASAVARESQTEIAKKMNRTIVGQAREFVWGIDDSQLSFVRRRMGTTPPREIITDEQRARAIAAARGETTVTDAA